ncbi:MAG: HDOD domain-containing protein [bacterium]|nr:HDOD domain-containing protein [bacterium]
MGHAISDVLELLTSVPPFPKAVMKLIQILGNDNVTSSELGEIISSDPALTIKILHLANSPFYMCSRRINSVEEAVIVLGIGTLKSVSAGAAMHHGIQKLMPPPHTFNVSAYWSHSFATAIAARKLAEKVKGVDKDICYVAGLTHDIGKVIQAKHWPEAWKAAIAHTENTLVDYDEIEIHYFGFSHREITAQLCEQWGFPAAFINLIPERSAPEETEIDSSQADSLITVAESLANAAGFTFPVPPSSDLSDSLRAKYEHIMDCLAQEVSHQLKILG